MFRRNFRAHFREPAWRSGRVHMYASSFPEITETLGQMHLRWHLPYFFCFSESLYDNDYAFFDTRKLSHDMTKPTKWVHPAKTGISLGICPIWSESSLCTQWVAKDPSFLHANSKDSDQTGQIPKLIWVLAGRTAILLVLSCRGSNVHLRLYSGINLVYIKLLNLPSCFICSDYLKNNKNSDIKKNFCNYAKFWTMLFYLSCRRIGKQCRSRAAVWSQWSGSMLFAPDLSVSLLYIV